MTRHAPWGREFSVPLTALQSELNRIFETYWNPARFTAGPAPGTDPDLTAWSPPVDLTETADAYLVAADVPGVDPASIDLSLTGNLLRIRGDKPKVETRDGSDHLRERVSGPFLRQIALPGEVDFESTRAEARDGVLKIVLPKRQAGRARTIPVQTA